MTGYVNHSREKTECVLDRKYPELELLEKLVFLSNSFFVFPCRLIKKLIWSLRYSGLFFEKHLKFIKLSEVFVPFTEMDLSYLSKVNETSTFHIIADFDWLFLFFSAKLWQNVSVSSLHLSSCNIWGTETRQRCK